MAEKWKWRSRWLSACAGLLLFLLVRTNVPAVGQAGQARAVAGEWTSYGADLANTRYSPLDQINATNFETLEMTWRFKTDNLGPRPDFSLQATPLMVDGTLYTTAGTRRAVVALDAETGEMKWMFSLDEGERGTSSSRGGSGRGVAYWSDGPDARIVYVTPGYQLVALDAKTGRPAPTFGKDGIVDLRQEADQEIDLVTGDMALRTPPVVAGNTIIVGASGAAGTVPKSRTNPKFHVRAYDARTGKRLWIFHTVPRPGEFGVETWERDSWSYTGHTGVWGAITVDRELGHVYLPVETPTGDHYGGHRPGANLFSDSLVALDLKTGKRIWHYQFVHHDIWDFDLPCAPILADITVNGRAIKAIAQPTKQSWLYVFDRVTGTPVWPIEERPVPAGQVPGEWYSPTQPFPTKPPAYDRQGVSADDLIDFTPELRSKAVAIASQYKFGPIFTPPVVSRGDGPLGTLLLPNIAGGANWPGASFDPETGMLYVYSATQMMPLGLVKPNASRSDMNFVVGTAPKSDSGNDGASPSDLARIYAGSALEIDGLPLVKPPYGRITALDLNKGELVWQIAHGETPDVVKNHPLLKGITVPRTGIAGRMGTLVTKTLVIAGERSTFTNGSGQRVAMLRAYDKATGEEVAAIAMPAAVTGVPMTYMLNGRQYISLAVGGPGYSSELRTLRLAQ